MNVNDFTKEDLHCLHNAIDIQLKTVPMSKLNVKRRRELLEKLQSMIDNYDSPTECPSAHEFYEKLLCEQCGLIEDL